MTSGIPCMLMRGGTSKGAYFLASDLPASTSERDDLLLRIMGSPDPRQIDGIGGGHPLTSKVAVVSRSARADADVDYLFLQVGVEEATVSDRQNCGNLLAGVASFALDRGLADRTPVRVHMANSGDIAIASPHQDGTVILGFTGTGDGTVFPTGSVRDVIDGIPVTCVNAGMPVVVVSASDLGRTGYEPIADLEAHPGLAAQVTALRRAAGELMGLGDVSTATVPKLALVAPPADGGTICTRTFIPVRVHEAIGVLGAVSVAAAISTAGTAGHDLAQLTPGQTRFDIEHPSGHTEVEAQLDGHALIRSGVVRIARKLFDGMVFPRPAGRAHDTDA
jgi:4-oxalomesaconate tautomerase